MCTVLVLVTVVGLPLLPVPKHSGTAAGVAGTGAGDRAGSKQEVGLSHTPWGFEAGVSWS